MFITAAPTVVPTILTSLSPISTIPSALPSITGAVSSVSMSGLATGDISTDELSDIETQIAEIYGVDVSDLEMNINYITSGVLNITIPDDISKSDAIKELQISTSDVLGVHPSDILVTIADDGLVTYSVIGSSFEEANALQNTLTEPSFVSNLMEDLVESTSHITVVSNVANDDIEMVISTTIDTSESSSTVDYKSAIAALAEEYGFTNSTIEGKPLNFSKKFALNYCNCTDFQDLQIYKTPW